MDINLGVTSQDSGKPAAFLNDTYETLKHNPQATQQTLQQGQAAGLAGLGAMAAQRYQNRVNHSQQAQQSAAFGQNPQPTVLEQLQMAAMQGGIMGQLTGNIQMAQAPQAPQGGMGLGDMPVSPATLPQEGMAGGGLVALAAGGYLDADGGDYYDAEQGYADGGGVRGFDGGGPARAYDPTETPWDYIKGLIGDDETSELKRLNQYYGYTEPSPSKRRELEAMWAEEEGIAPEADRGGRNGEVPLGHVETRTPKAQPDKAATNYDKVFKDSLMDSNHLAQGAVDRIKQAALRDNTVDAAQQVEEGRQNVAANGGIPAIQGQRAAQTEAMPEEDGPTAEEIRDRILALRGGAPSGMSAEEKAWRQEQADTAKTEKWLQTLTAMAAGTFGGGGRTWPEAIGQGALYGLSAYRQGAAAEGEAELGMLQAQSAYAEAQRKAQQDAADKLLGIQSKKMELGSAADTARAKAKADWAKTEFTEAGKDRRAQLNAIAVGAKDAVTRDKAIAEMVKMEVEEATKLNPAISPEEVDAIRAKYYQYYGATPPGLGGGQGLSGGMGMGNVPTITKTGTIIPARS